MLGMHRVRRFFLLSQRTYVHMSYLVHIMRKVSNSIYGQASPGTNLAIFDASSPVRGDTNVTSSQILNAPSE